MIVVLVIFLGVCVMVGFLFEGIHFQIAEEIQCCGQLEAEVQKLLLVEHWTKLRSARKRRNSMKSLQYDSIQWKQRMRQMRAMMHRAY